MQRINPELFVDWSVHTDQALQSTRLERFAQGTRVAKAVFPCGVDCAGRFSPLSAARVLQKCMASSDRLDAMESVDSGDLESVLQFGLHGVQHHLSTDNLQIE